MQLDDAQTLSPKNAVKCGLAGEMLRRFGTLRLQVTGHSMLPSIWPGDILVIEHGHLGEVSAGDIVLYAREGRLCAHRVIRKDGDLENPRLVTQGDAMLTADPPIAAEEFLGKVSQIFHAGKPIAPAAVPTFQNKLVAGIARHSTPAARFLVHWHVSRANRRKREALCPS